MGACPGHYGNSYRAQTVINKYMGQGYWNNYVMKEGWGWGGDEAIAPDQSQRNSLFHQITSSQYRKSSNYSASAN